MKLLVTRGAGFIGSNLIQYWIDKYPVDEILKDIDAIVHFAADSHVDRSISDPDPFIKTNIEGTYVLLKIALKNKIKHFHHISTDEVFGSLELGTKEKFNE